MRGLILIAVLSGCSVVTQGFQTVDRTLSKADQRILNQCADLDNPTNAARIDALALITTSTQAVEAGRARREAYCEYKRQQVAQ